MLYNCTYEEVKKDMRYEIFTPCTKYNQCHVHYESLTERLCETYLYSTASLQPSDTPCALCPYFLMQR